MESKQRNATKFVVFYDIQGHPIMKTRRLSVSSVLVSLIFSASQATRSMEGISTGEDNPTYPLGIQLSERTDDTLKPVPAIKNNASRRITITKEPKPLLAPLQLVTRQNLKRFFPLSSVVTIKDGGY